MSNTDDKNAPSVDEVITGLMSEDGSEAISAGAEELVDLDALFDALNIAATEGEDAIRFNEPEDQQGGILTVSVDLSGTDDLGPVSDELMSKDMTVSDES